MKKNIRQIYVFLHLFLLLTAINSYVKADTPRLFILSIGATPPAIQYTVEDALDFAHIFENQANNSGIYSEVISKTLTGKYANAENIRKEITVLSKQKKLKANDLIILFISSHGFIDNDGNFRVQASDYTPSNTTTSISIPKILQLLETSKARKLIFMDACSSGGGVHTSNENIAPEDDDYADNNPSIVVNTKSINPRKRNRTKLAAYNKGIGTTIITSSIGSTNSYYHDIWQNGAFTEALLKGFNGNADRNEDQFITTGEIFAYIQQQIPQLCKSQGIRDVQRPGRTLNGLGDNFPFFSTKQLTHNSHKQLAHLLNIQYAEPVSQIKWIHNSEALFNDSKRLIVGEAAFMGKGHLVNLKIKTTTQGDFTGFYNDKPLPPTLTLHLTNAKQIKIYGIEHFTMYSEKYNKTEHITTFIINEDEEKMLAQYPIESITMTWEVVNQKYIVNHGNALKKQLKLLKMARKEKLIPTKSDKKYNKKL